MGNNLNQIARRLNQSDSLTPSYGVVHAFRPEQPRPSARGITGAAP
nr:plasmid mobilization relaxosome protein MobC [Escherichia coli]